MEYLLTIFYAAVFVFVIFKASFFKARNIHRKYIAGVFVLKIFAGILLGYLYKIYFNGGDTFIFFSDANTMFEILKSHPVDFFKLISGLQNSASFQHYYQQLAGWKSSEYFYNDSKTIIRINALIRIFSFGYYNVHVVFFSFLSLTGLHALYKIFSQAVPGKERELFFAAFLIPSVFFWTSGILKEGVLVFALGMFLFCFVRLVAGAKKIKYMVMAGCSLLLLVYVKVYILLIILPGMFAYVWTIKTSYSYSLLKFIIMYLGYFMILFNLKYINSNYNLSEIIYWKQHNTIGMARFMNSGSFVEPPLLKPDAMSILKNIPRALWNTLIHPDLTHARNPFALLAAIENLMIIFWVLISLLHSGKLCAQQKPLFLFSLFFVFFLYILIGLTSPVIGSMVRYKVPALPFLMMMMAVLYKKKKPQLS